MKKYKTQDFQSWEQTHSTGCPPVTSGVFPCSNSRDVDKRQTICPGGLLPDMGQTSAHHFSLAVIAGFSDLTGERRLNVER